MSTDYRALCAELLDEVAARPLILDRELINRARAALAEPEPEAVGPSDEELDALWFEIDGRQGLGWKSFARAVLACWGNHFPDTGKMVSPTTEGEVAWLIEFLRNFGDELMNEHGGVAEHNLLTRAADLLEQRHPVPVPVAERLPGPEDCDAEGRAWFLSFPFEYNRMIWSLEDRTYGCNTGFTHWLPANALPLPSGEVEHD